MKRNNSQKAFFSLLQAGLWSESEKQVSIDGFVDWEGVYRLASEQSVLGVVLAGIDYLPNEQKPPKIMLLQWIGEIQMLEQQNQAMNKFIGELVEKMRVAGIYTLLVKGQGVAQCYEKPLWRSCGDVDFLLSNDNYKKAKSFLIKFANHVEEEDKEKLHFGMTIDKWTVKLHGTMRTQISSRMNCGIDEVQYDCFCRGNVRSWMNDGTQVYLPGPNNDAILIFTHYLQHFFFGGVGLRQICDWCRLLWTYRDSIDTELLESRLLTMGLMTEWQVFAAFAVDYLGMPKECMPLFIESSKMKRRATKLANWMLRSGKRRHDQDNSYRAKHSKLVTNCITFGHRLYEFANIATIFSKNAPVFFVHYVVVRFKATML